jgi:hypothetical protein
MPLLKSEGLRALLRVECPETFGRGYITGQVVLPPWFAGGASAWLLLASVGWSPQPVSLGSM